MMNEEIRKRILREASQEGYARKQGLALVDIAPGYAVVEMLPQETDLNLFRMVHGGAVFSLLDEAFQISCNSHGTVAVALNVSVVYHNPAVAGRRLRAVSREVHISNKTATYEIRVEDEEDLLIATCQALAYRTGKRLPFLDKDEIV